jgi:hypothetical protein
VPAVCQKRYFRRVARDFERSFAAARVAYEGNDTRNALRELERARRAALKQRDEEQLRRVLDFAEGSLARDEQTEIERENLLYSVRQNLRQLSRRRALRGGGPWEDPFPDLAAPQAHTRTFISRGVKFWIGVGILVGLLFVAAFVAALIAGAFSSAGDDLRLRVRNDTGGRVTVKWCTTARCNEDFGPIATVHLDPGEYARQDLPADDVVDLFVVEGSGVGRVCLPVRVDRTYEGLTNPETVVVVRVSQATPCPGEIVTPRPAGFDF